MAYSVYCSDLFLNRIVDCIDLYISTDGDGGEYWIPLTEFQGFPGTAASRTRIVQKLLPIIDNRESKAYKTSLSIQVKENTEYLVATRHQ